MAEEMGFNLTVLGSAFVLFNLFQGLPGPQIGYAIQKKGSQFCIADCFFADFDCCAD